MAACHRRVHLFLGPDDRLTKPTPALFERDKPTPANDQMIQYIDIQQLAGLDDCPRQGDIIRAGGRIAARMVVNNNHGCSITPDGSLEQFCFSI